MTGAYLGYLVCLRCGLEVPETQAFSVCGRCDAENVPANALPAYDLDRVRGWQPDNAAPGLFRYRALLPIAGRTASVSIGEGRTSLVRQKRIGAQVGVEELYFKNESSNQTWSYKDRLAAVAGTKAKEMGSDTLIVSTTGNHGAAVAAYAAAANLRCVVLTEEAVPLSMKVLIQSYAILSGTFVVDGEKRRAVAQLLGYRTSYPYSRRSEAGLREKAWSDNARNRRDIGGNSMIPEMTRILGTAATLYGLGGALSVLLQARQMHARGTSCDVSARFLAVYVGGFAIWLLYGLGIGSVPIIVVHAVGLLCGSITLAVALRLRRPAAAATNPRVPEHRDRRARRRPASKVPVARVREETCE